MAAMFGHATTAISCMWKPEILCTKHGYRKACNVGATPCPEQVFHELKCSRAIIWQTPTGVEKWGTGKICSSVSEGVTCSCFRGSTVA
jgi:hypothetical protein